MRVTDIINKKGGEVVTLPPNASVGDLVKILADRRIGAVVVLDDERLAGIVSERDVVRYVNEVGDLSAQVSAIMTVEVTSCGMSDDIADLARVMTAKRIRHVPVVEDDKLVAIISIGDVVKGSG